MSFKFAVPLYAKILIGMLAGVLIGIAALTFQQTGFVNNWVRPWGQVFIRLLQLIAVPLVFVSLVKGVIGLSDIGKFSRIGIRTIILYLLTTAFAVTVGMSLGLVVRPGQFVDRQTVVSMQENYKSVVEQKKAEADTMKNSGPLSFLEEVVPDNFVAATSDNRKMLQVIFFAVLFGIAALCIERTKIVPVEQLFDSLYHILLKVIDFVIMFAPYGVTALMAGLVIDFSGNLSMFGALAVYAITVVGGLLFLISVFYPTLIYLFTKMKPNFFIKTMYPVQLFAFTTSSSAATLPLNLETTENKLGVSNEVTSFVLPVGATINMDGTSCYQAIAVLFIAQVIGIDLTLMQLFTIILMTIISSIGTPSIPGGSYVILTMVLASVGIPPEGLALILGIDRPLDMLRTAVNVTGDATVAAIVDTQNNKQIS
ncbi:dicarboxylate/amino acid:cation symporter [Macellibacteroides fermentans]|uniref:Na+/H+-dicarboxylate symporter n=1 Tax=Macellibacteroides fermentans TaxID=879969 RepID=A0A8E2A0M7_9PORP|nr:dicarboxylate/amino acid:cation symporter [Macellibacteroides fermentans]NYI51165.1 Na+/H+-dicarboxylate symporter [Macellibacteroides fermentans]